MIPRIKEILPLENYLLRVVFSDGKAVVYDVKEDMEQIESYRLLRTLPGLFQQVALDESKTCIYWNDEIDLPSDILYEYGKQISAR